MLSDLRCGTRYCGLVKVIVIAYRCHMLFLGVQYISNVLCFFIWWFRFLMFSESQKCQTLWYSKRLKFSRYNFFLSKTIICDVLSVWSLSRENWHCCYLCTTCICRILAIVQIMSSSNGLLQKPGTMLR